MPTANAARENGRQLSPTLKENGRYKRKTLKTGKSDNNKSVRKR